MNHDVLAIVNITLAVNVAYVPSIGLSYIQHVLRDVLYVPSWPGGECVSFQRFMGERERSQRLHDDEFLGQQGLGTRGNKGGSGEAGAVGVVRARGKARGK